MKTAEEFFDDWCEQKGYVSIDQADDIEECLEEYAKAAIEEYKELLRSELGAELSRVDVDHFKIQLK